MTGVWVLRDTRGVIVGASAGLAKETGARGTQQTIANAFALGNITPEEWRSLMFIAQSPIGIATNKLPDGYTLTLEPLAPLPDVSARDRFTRAEVLTLCVNVAREFTAVREQEYAEQVAERMVPSLAPDFVCGGTGITPAARAELQEYALYLRLKARFAGQKMTLASVRAGVEK